MQCKYVEATYVYEVSELVAELQARISGAVDSKAFASDIVAAVVSCIFSLITVSI